MSIPCDTDIFFRPPKNATLLRRAAYARAEGKERILQFYKYLRLAMARRRTVPAGGRACVLYAVLSVAAVDHPNRHRGVTGRPGDRAELYLQLRQRPGGPAERQGGDRDHAKGQPRERRLVRRAHRGRPA